MNCPLCKQPGKPFYADEFLMCNNCSAIYKNKKNYLSTDAEINRYKQHNNDINDIRYQKFVSPITDYVLNNFTPDQSGLDFGSGTAPVISKILQDNGYNVHQFDPFFSNKTELLKGTYNYIVSCEVIEHFHNPDVEFKLLHKMLKSDGALICMTHLYNKNIDFKNWYYKNDPTHVFIYCQETIEYISDYYGFINFTIDNRLIVLKKGKY
ncbi:class I SAM-dependent methyltransferase [Plectonema cf. radiosum LEGE 06105]|uniref:Class I SAM-dependent methyltransferase n=1 Tax=Plectonema cf. radiosum LEGE 06105 TaxID=945769 RepID=A0A8J7FCQ8_9CYAN|nr:class I SAM-dependent methyltransferase [Plectonema radiosum]MBE9216079.1 class I SAM-dependent methyltransferase [Plectonema cf. radiosum LEGE 06105]